MMYNYFYLLYFNIALLLVLTESLFKFSLNNSFLSSKKGERGLCTLVVIVLLSLILGFRPGSTEFGDTVLYQYNYENRLFIYPDEPIFDLIGKVCGSIGLPTGIYLSFIAFIYIYLPYHFISKHTKSKWFTLLMILTSFSFLGYGVNGIRNGLSLSLLTYSFAFVDINGTSKINYIKILICCLISLGIHKSAMLPITCMVVSLFIIKRVKTAILIWLLSIPISLVGGDSIAPFFMGLGFDNRLDEYLVGIYKTGFRWDFILYSAVPIILAYYIVFIKKITVDRLYVLLVNTYTLSNAIWIIIINSAFSNRFAYLSWFLYPIVITYPLLKFKLWNNQKSKVAIFLVFYYLFTYIILFPTY